MAKDTPQTSGTESEEAPKTEGLSSVDLMIRQMDLEAGIPGELNDSGDIVRRIQASILSGQTDDEVFAAASAGLTSAEELVDVPLAIVDYAYNRSGFVDAALPVYAVVTAIHLDNAQEFQFSIGAASALTQLHRFEQLKSFKTRRENGEPLYAAVESKKTSAGFQALFFRPLSEGERKRLGIGG